MQEVTSVLDQLIDDDECWFDHHGYCQAHYLQDRCVMPRAKALLHELKQMGFTPE